MIKTIIRILCVCVPLFFGNKLTAQVKPKRPKVGLVLSGGGAKGLAYIGLLKVIQEANLPIDFIGGTSIGAIIGGMYAIGYHPNTIDSLIRVQDWDLLLSQRLDRKFVAFEDKIFSDKYLFSVPVEDFKLSLKPSVFDSPHIDVMLNRMFFPACGQTDFSKLPIPFLCMATDLVTGEPVSLKSGYLPAAIRSSMAIPGYWSPMHYNGHYLVDGAVVNNYPAQQVKDMGADIIIGGDVQAELKSDIEELQSLPQILDQIVSFHHKDANVLGRALTDIYVRFEMEYSGMDFNNHDSIIAIGERVAGEYLDEFKHLADSLNQIEYKPIGIFDTRPSDSLKLNKISFKSNSKTRPDFVTGYFKESYGEKVTWDDIHNSIQYAYGTSYYRALFPEIRHENGETNLILNLEESPRSQVSLGFHYDNNYKGSILANFTTRNFIGQQSTLFFDCALGQNPRLNTMYILNNRNRPGFGIDIDLYKFEFSSFESKTAINTWNYNNFGGGIFMPLTIRNSFMFRLGGRYDLFKNRQNILIDSNTNIYSAYRGFGTAYFSFNFDTRERVYFSNKGSKTELKGKYIVPLNKNEGVHLSNAVTLYLDHEKNIALGRGWVAKPGLFLGYTLAGNAVPIQHQFGIGGANETNYVDSYVPFTGMEFIQEIGQYAGIARLKLQYTPLKNFYLTALADMGKIEMDVENISTKDFNVGYGMRISYNSIIGPFEFSIMRSNVNPGTIFFIKIGQWF